MMKSFLINFFLLILLAACSTDKTLISGEPLSLPLWTTTLVQDSVMNTYQITLQIGEKNMTGICLLKKTGDKWNGSLINEFGIKAFDFTSDEGMTHLHHIVSFLDKWYIRRTIEQDLHYLFNIDATKTGNEKKRYIRRKSPTSFILVNRIHHIQYSFNRIPETK
ncbi:MAG: hypothetical protein PHG06_02600 [Parabacteroides sp.]|nr:hypothetical protein [Parabacteroides sp.]